jgi:hypothetical protein
LANGTSDGVHVTLYVNGADTASPASSGRSTLRDGSVVTDASTTRSPLYLRSKWWWVKRRAVAPAAPGRGASARPRNE